MSFAKSPIANAKITAKITVSKAYQKMSSEQIALPEISTHTNADGTFKIPFKMIVSDRDQIENKPYHTYSFEIDVQDETGEVRSTAKNIYYSYNDLSVKLNALDYLDKRVPLHVNITAQTANGKTAKVRGKLKVLLVNDYESYYKKRSEEHTSELQSRPHLVCRLLLEKKKKTKKKKKNKKKQNNL